MQLNFLNFYSLINVEEIAFWTKTQLSVLGAKLDYSGAAGKTLISSKLCAKEKNKYSFQLKS